MSSRRVFLTGSAAVLLNFPTAVALAQRRTAAAAGSGGDAILDEIIRQLERAGDAMARNPRGETTRQLAAATRLFAAWGQVNHIDAQIQTELRQQLRQHGRTALLGRSLNMADEMELRGIALPPGDHRTAAISARVFDDVLTNGLTGRFLELAQVLEAGAASLDRRGLVALQDPECDAWKFWLLTLESWAVLACTVAPVFPEFCAVLVIEIAALKWYMWWKGCS